MMIMALEITTTQEKKNGPEGGWKGGRHGYC